MSCEQFLPDWASERSKELVKNLYSSCQSEGVAIADLLTDASADHEQVPADELDLFLISILEEVEETARWGIRRIQYGGNRP